MNPNAGNFRGYAFGGNPSGGLQLGRWFGIPVDFRMSVLLLLLLIVMRLGDAYPLPLALLVALGVFASILAHEFGHALVARVHGLRTHGITLHFFGGVARVEQTRRPLEEFWIAVAGPLVNIAIAGFLMLVMLLLPAQSDVATAVWHLAFLNGILALFNLVPGYPMDGGRVLRAYFWWKWRDLPRASAAAARGGEWVALTCIGLGIAGLLGIIPLFGFGMILGGGFLWMLARFERLRSQLLGSAGGVDIAELLRRQGTSTGGNIFGGRSRGGAPFGAGASSTEGATPSATTPTDPDTLQRGQVEVIVREPDGRETKYRRPPNE